MAGESGGGMGKARWIIGNGASVAMRALLRRIAVLVCATVCLIGVTACAPVYRDHGYVPTDTDLAQIKVGTDTRETVAGLIGRPSASALLNDTGWYYVQSRWKYFGARAPQEFDRQVVAITFTDAGIVENVERFGLENGRVVTLSRRVTDSNIKGVGFLRQLMGNLGRVQAADTMK